LDINELFEAEEDKLEVKYKAAVHHNHNRKKVINPLDMPVDLSRCC